MSFSPCGDRVGLLIRGKGREQAAVGRAMLALAVASVPFLVHATLLFGGAGLPTTLNKAFQGIGIVLWAIFILECVRRYRQPLVLEGHQTEPKIAWALWAVAGLSNLVWTALGMLPVDHVLVEQLFYNLPLLGLVLYPIGLILQSGTMKHMRFGLAAIDALTVSLATSVVVWHILFAARWKAVQVPVASDFVLITALLLVTANTFTGLFGLFGSKEDPRGQTLAKGAVFSTFAIGAAIGLLAAVRWNSEAPIDPAAYGSLYAVAGLILGQCVRCSTRAHNSDIAGFDFGKFRFFGMQFAELQWYVPFCCLFFASLQIAVSDWMLNGHINVLGHPEFGVLVALIIIRQIAVIGENRRLNETLDSTNRSLNEMVDYLRSLSRFTSAINESLDVKTVMDLSAKHALEIMSCDAVSVSIDGEDLEVTRPKGEEREVVLALIRQAKRAVALPVQLVEFDAEGEEFFATVIEVDLQEEGKARFTAVRKGRKFVHSELHLLNGIAEEVGKALHNARVHASALDAADRDAVTGLLNHRAFHIRVQTEMEKCEVLNIPMSVAMIDLNNFKLFNDTYGHLAGDAVLRHVADAFVAEAPEGVLTARYGGDEFGLAWPGHTDEDLEMLSEAIKDHIEKHPFEVAGNKVPVTLSFGIACYPIDGASRHDLLNVADRNLYEIKQAGGGIRRASMAERENRALRSQASFETVDALVSAVDNKDRYTRKHSEDVTEYALWIAEEIGMSEDAMRAVRRAGLLHDVGKIGVPDSILRKPGKLTPEEVEIIQRHPRLGELIVRAIPGLEDVIDGVRSHHERWDGAGYPDQLRGDEIPLMGRLLAVADAFSAMTTDRPYRKGMPITEALNRIEEGTGSQFDPKMASAFMDAARERLADKIESELGSPAIPKAA